MFVSNVNSIQSHGCLPNVADHEGIFVSFHNTQQKVPLQTRTCFDYKNVDEKGLIKYLNEIDYGSLVFSLPVCDQAEAYTNILIQAREKFVTTKTILIRPCDQPWVNSYTRLLLRKKNRNYQIFKKFSSKLAKASSDNVCPELVTRLSDKKQRSYRRYRTAANESQKGNRRPS